MFSKKKRQKVSIWVKLFGFCLWASNERYSSLTLISVIFLGDEFDQIDDSVWVAVFVVIPVSRRITKAKVHNENQQCFRIRLPWDKFNKVVVERNTSSGIEDWWVCVTNEVRRNNFIISVAQNTFQWTVGSFFDGLTNFVVFSLSQRKQSQDQSVIHWVNKIISIERTPLLNRAVRSTTETFGVGTRKAIPVSFPFKSGITLPTWKWSSQQIDDSSVSLLKTIDETKTIYLQL